MIGDKVLLLLDLLSYELSLTQTIEHWDPLRPSRGSSPANAKSGHANQHFEGEGGGSIPLQLQPALPSTTLTRDVPSYKLLEIADILVCEKSSSRIFNFLH